MPHATPEGRSDKIRDGDVRSATGLRLVAGLWRVEVWSLLRATIRRRYERTCGSSVAMDGEQGAYESVWGGVASADAEECPVPID